MSFDSLTKTGGEDGNVTLSAWLGWRWIWWVAGAGLVLAPSRGHGQAATAEAALVQMGAQAGVIFAGQVKEVRHEDARGWVEVRFKVDVPVRGAGGGEYVVKEWAGLWTGAERYRMGGRYLMLLTPRAASGLSGPVNGMDGAIPLVVNARETGVDLRWIEAGRLRGPGAAGGLNKGGRQTGLMGAGIEPLAGGKTGSVMALSAALALLQPVEAGAHEGR